jgi:hypothetical protein
MHPCHSEAQGWHYLLVELPSLKFAVEAELMQGSARITNGM